MKVVGHLNAVAAWRETIEEYAPLRGSYLPEIIAGVRMKYGFVSAPDADPTDNSFMFLQGKYQSESESFGVGMLLMEPYGDLAQTVTTDQAETFLTDFTRYLDETFGYRLTKSVKRKSYVSNIVVEFDGPIESASETLTKIGALVQEIFPVGADVGLKRLAFGNAVLKPTVDQITQAENADFLIERRAGSPYEANRYYCSAPLRSREHVQLLERIEAIALGKAT